MELFSAYPKLRLLPESRQEFSCRLRPKFPRVVGVSTGISMGAERGAEALLATNEHSVIVGRAAVEEWVW